MSDAILLGVVIGLICLAVDRWQAARDRAEAEPEPEPMSMYDHLICDESTVVTRFGPWEPVKQGDIVHLDTRGRVYLATDDSDILPRYLVLHDAEPMKDRGVALYPLDWGDAENVT